MKVHLAVLVALSSLLLLNIQNVSTYETREILPNTGFWNYLPVFGIWARIVHYLAVDSDGLGNQVKMLDKYFKKRHGTQEYVDLLNQVVEKLPKIVIAFRVLKIKDNLREVRDPITKRTLGEAFDIIHEIENDENTVNEIASRLNLINPDNISMTGSAPVSDFQLETTIKNALLEKPEVIGDVLKDPQIISFITGSILEYLSSDQLIHGIETLQQLITIWEISHPNMFEEGQNSLTDLRDEKTGMSFIKTLETLVSIIEDPDFPQELVKVLNTETLTDLHEKTNDLLSKIIDKPIKNVAKKRQNQVREMSTKEFVDTLNMLNIELDEKTAESILKSSQNNELGNKAGQFLTELAAIEDLTPEKVVRFIGEKGVVLNESLVTDGIHLISSLTPDMLSNILGNVGLNLPKEQAEQMQKIVKELKQKYDIEHPLPTETEPDFDPDEGDTRQSPPHSLFH